MTDIPQETLDGLVSRALDARKNAYAPYSRFAVGAAVLAASGKTYAGANVENSSYPAGTCAERNAVGAAVGAGERRLLAVAICGGPEDGPAAWCSPCGICRQTLREFCDPERFVIITAKSETDYICRTLAELLPESFGPGNLV